MKAKLLGVGVAIVLAFITPQQSNADIYNVLGSFDDGTFMTGRLGFDESNRLNFIDIHAPGTLASSSPDSIVGTATSCNENGCVFPSTDFLSRVAQTGPDSFDLFVSGNLFLFMHFTLSEDGGTILSGILSNPHYGPQVIPIDSYARLTGGTLSPVPIPAALPLFATGLGLLGWLGWRRRRA